MKRLHLLLYMILVCLGLQAQEAEQGEQLLVFRNTGVVDLLYTQEVDSILTTDKSSMYPVPMSSQMFANLFSSAAD